MQLVMGKLKGNQVKMAMSVQDSYRKGRKTPRVEEARETHCILWWYIFSLIEIETSA